MEYNKQRIALDTAFNVRDLSGYHTMDGKVTGDVFVRSDFFAPLSEKDANALYELGIRTVVDLRSREEEERLGNNLAGVEGITCYPEPIFGKGETRTFEYFEGFTMGLLYAHILDNCQSPLHKVMRCFLNAHNGKILFHCSAGKDRTGVVAALLLKLADVDDETVVYDFALTDTFLAEVKDVMRENSGIPTLMGEQADELLSANPENMQYMLAHLSNTYGTAERYLIKIGLTEAECEALKAKVLA